MYDFSVACDPVECIDFARELGWKGLCYLMDKDDFNSKIVKSKLDIIPGIFIEAENMNKISRIVDAFRDRAQLVFVRGGDAELNRYIINMPKVDVLTNVAIGDQFDHVMAKLAVKNHIALEFRFIDLLHSYAKTRSRLLANFMKNAELVRKFKVPFVITSGAMSKWDMRSPHDLMVFGRALGFQDPEMKAAMSSMLIDANRKKLSGTSVMQGVEEI